MKTLVTFSVILLTATTSFGALVSGVTSSNPGVVTVTGFSVTNVTTSAPFQTADLAINLTVNQKHIPANLNFSFTPDAITFTSYDVTLNITNALTPATGGTDYMNGFDIQNGPTATGGSAAISSGVLPTSSFTVDADGSNYNIGSGFRFGGLNGGGIGATYNGSPAAVATFQWDTTGSSLSAASMIFTANPEPGTVLLAGLAMLPLGVVVRRRRKAAVAASKSSNAT